MARRDGGTLDLFHDWAPPQVAVTAEPSAHPDIKARISMAVSQTLRDCGRSREVIAEEMGVSPNTLNNYASAGQEGHSIRLDQAIALVAATGDPRVLAQELAPLGFAVIPERFLGAVEEAMCAEQLEVIQARQKMARRKWRGGGRS